MIPFLGRTLILLSLLAATAGAIAGFAAGARKSATGWGWTKRLAYFYAACIVGANLLMTYALLVPDFSVSYVAQVGSRALPTWVKIVTLWSSLEGSILFWGMLLGVYVFMATFLNRNKYPEYMPYATAVWLACSAFFSFLIAGPAQPFLTMSPVPGDGPGPNPLLQNHVLMAIHPPFLYLGYVGMTIPFGLASAALLTGRLGHDFLKPMRTWLMIPWIFLTIAIVMGGWWAYEVLGWGGYWAWDPVENASFLPWLTATAALHSAIVMERKGVLKGWTTTLLMATFLLVVLGTFMTRSGVFNSVHSFTQSSIGPTILVFLAAALLWSLVLLTIRIDKLSPDGDLGHPASREGTFLVNNLLFVLFTFTVLVGTVFPLLVEAIRNVQMSVGRPYFDKMAIPIGLALLFLMGVGPALPWGRATGEQIRKSLIPPAITGAVLAVLGYAFGVRNGWTIAALLFGGFAIYVTVKEMFLPMVQRMKRGEGIGEAFVEGQLRRGNRRFGAYIVHAGVAIIIVAIAISSTMKVSKEVTLRQGETLQIGAYTLTFLGAQEVTEEHRAATIARVGVAKGGRDLGVMEPRMNQYFTQREPIGTPDVKTGITGDLYLSILSIDPRSGTLGLLAIINPMVGWIWFATGMMAFGGFMALLPTRQRAVQAVSVPSAVAEEAAR
ncbi:MAG: heme lyase CcmF/NrfE family subunit [Thermoanaerobaculia bacterium]